MHALGGRADTECRVYFTGGATAVLEGWRKETAIDPARFRRAVADALGPDRDLST